MSTLSHSLFLSLSLTLPGMLWHSHSCMGYLALALVRTLGEVLSRISRALSSQLCYCRVFVAPVRFGARHQLIGQCVTNTRSSRCSATSSGSFDVYAGVGVACATLCLLLFTTLCRCSSLLLLKAALRSSMATVGCGSQGNSAVNTHETHSYHIIK